MKEKSAITFTLGTSIMSYVCEIVDNDERSAKQLCDELYMLYKTSNAQVIIDLQQPLGNLHLAEDGDWEKHKEYLQEILSKPLIYNDPVEEEVKA